MITLSMRGFGDLEKTVSIHFSSRSASLKSGSEPQAMFSGRRGELIEPNYITFVQLNCDAISIEGN